MAEEDENNSKDTSNDSKNRCKDNRDEKSSSWEALPDDVKKDNANIAANSKGDSSSSGESEVVQFSDDDE